VWIALFLREQHLPWTSAFGFASPGLGRALSLAMLAGLVILICALELGWLAGEILNRLGGSPQVQETVQIMQSTEAPARQVFYGVVAILMVPVAEEMLFRGLLYPTVKQIGCPRLALWGTSILFAASHVNLMAFVPLIYVAVMLTLLYEETNNLLAPILAHSLFNAANFFLLLNEREVNRWLHWFYERI
jgi:membrane protease YdiL (CAAX protease family)